MAKSRIVSWPSRAASGSRSMAHPGVGSIPNSVVSPLQSSMEQAENRTPQPFGNSELNGMPDPPPVREPTIFTPGMYFMIETKLLAAENVPRDVSTIVGFPHMMRPVSAGSK